MRHIEAPVSPVGPRRRASEPSLPSPRGGAFYQPPPPPTQPPPHWLPPRSPASLVKLLSLAVGSAGVAALSTAGVFSKWVRRMAPPSLHFLPTGANRELVRAVPLLVRHYMPNVLSWNAHLAGFFGYVKLPGMKAVAVERITLSDGGTVSLEWSALPADGEPVILLLPGVNNDASIGYIQHLMRVLEEAGVGHAAALNWRGMGGLPLTAVTWSGPEK